MVFNGTTIPTGRDNTYSPNEVHRKSFNEAFLTAFNEDQSKVLITLLSEYEPVEPAEQELDPSSK